MPDEVYRPSHKSSAPFDGENNLEPRASVILGQRRRTHISSGIMELNTSDFGVPVFTAHALLSERLLSNFLNKRAYRKSK